MAAHERAPLRQAIAIELARAGLRLGFAPVLEAQFERDMRARRARHLLRAGLAALTAYNLYLSADCLTLPDVLRADWLLHLGIVTPLGLLTTLYLARTRHLVWREALASLAVLAALAGSVLLFRASNQPDTGYTGACFALYLLFANVVMRLRFGWALLFTLTASASVIPAILLHPGICLGARWQLALGFVCTGVATLYANYTVEAAERRAYLMMLRQQLDAADLADSNAALSTISTTDWLTGIANRRDFAARLERAWTHAAAAREPVALLMIDIDHFKAFNDAKGHQAGDTCLAQVAAALGEQLRDGLDTLARYGGEEFAAILPRVELEDALRSAERLRQAIEALRLPHGGPGIDLVTVSIGVAVARPDREGSVEQLLAAADNALYSAKQRGRNRVHPSLQIAAQSERPWPVWGAGDAVPADPA